MAIRSKMKNNSKSKRRTLKRQGGGIYQNPAFNVSSNKFKKDRFTHGNTCDKKKGTIKLSNDGNFLICKKSLKHLTKKGRKRKSTLSKNKQKICYNTTCWHKLSMKDKIVYKKKIKTLKKEEDARKASELTKEGKAEAKAKEEAAATKIQALFRGRMGRKKAKSKKELKEAKQAPLPPLPPQPPLPPLPSPQAKASLRWANHEGKNLTETKMYNRNAPISMATQNNSTPTNLAEQAEGGLKLNNTRRNMFATTAFTGKKESTGENVVSNANTVLQNTSRNNPAGNMFTPNSRKGRGKTGVKKEVTGANNKPIRRKHTTSRNPTTYSTRRNPTTSRNPMKYSTLRKPPRHLETP
jgi:hypothetical protein